MVVRARFGQWILDTASANYNQSWLDYQHEIGRRHHRSGKNRTDGVASTGIIPFRYLAPLIFPVTATLNSLWIKSRERREWRGARLTRRVREEYRVYFDRNATQSASQRRGSGGMHRRSNAA